MRPCELHSDRPTATQLAIITSLVRAERRRPERHSGPFVAFGQGSALRWDWSAAPSGVLDPTARQALRELPEGVDAIGMVSAGSASSCSARASSIVSVPVVVAWACLRDGAEREAEGVSLILWADGTAIWAGTPSGQLPAAATATLSPLPGGPRQSPS